MRRSILVLILATAVTGGFATIALGRGFGSVFLQTPDVPPHEMQQPTPEPLPSPESLLTPTYLQCTAPQEALNFPNYWAGQSFDGLPVTAVIRECNPPEEGYLIRANNVTYIYGSCTPTPEEGCPPPIAIKTWPSRERNKASIDLFPAPFADPNPTEETTVLGAPATLYNDGTRLEVYFPEATVVIFGDDRARLLRFGEALIEGPDVLTELQTYGLIFGQHCLEDVKYCMASSDVPGGVWLDPDSGPCFNVATEPAQTWCAQSDPASPVEVSNDPQRGLCLTVSAGEAVSPRTWCTGDDTQEAPVGVWFDPEQGVCLSSDNPLMFWCSGSPTSVANVWLTPEEGLCLQANVNPPKTWCSGPISN